jgi:hypothetical protein
MIIFDMKSSVIPLIQRKTILNFFEIWILKKKFFIHLNQ